jgi:heterogeneous nuclear ribonucleoprotein K
MRHNFHNYFYILFLKTPIKGPVHNYDPHNFDDMYADEYGGYGSGMNTGNFRNSNAGGNTGGGGGRFGNDRGL